MAALVASCDIDHSVKPSTLFRGGYGEARRRLEHLVATNTRRDAEDAASRRRMRSPYLHFGHISSFEVPLETKTSAEFQEELIVRRELSFNFCRHATFDSLDSLPARVQAQLREHSGDPRPVTFTLEQMELAQTCDLLWNATQKYDEAFDAMICFHDRYALDGCDPNTYTNVLWRFGLHDQPWTERPVFGKIRYMSYEGMRRKTTVDAHIRETDHLERTGRDLAAI